MEKLKKLIAHFRGYQKQAGKQHEVQVDIKAIPMVRKAAEEEEKIPSKVPEKATGKAPEPISVVDKVEDLDKYVKKIIDRELETTIKRVIEEVVRKELGKPLTQLEQGVRDEVQTEVADQARNVERDIKRVAPGAPVAAPVKEEKAATPPPPKAAGQSINWARSSKVSVESDLPKPILLEEGVSIQPLMNDPTQGEVVVTDETGQIVNTGIKIELSPGLDPEQQKTLAMGTLEKIVPAMTPEAIVEEK